MHDHVDVAALPMIVIGAVVDHRRGSETRSAEQDATGFYCALAGLCIGLVTVGDMIHIAIESPDILIQIHELLRRDDPTV